MSRPPRIAGVGEYLWDVYPDRRFPGGGVANVVRHAHRLGMEGVLVSAVGNDENGEKLKEELRSSGMTADFIQVHPASVTGSVRVTIGGDGSPLFQCSEDTAFDHLQYRRQLDVLAREIDGVVVGTLAQRHTDSRKVIGRFLRRTGACVVFDANFHTLDHQTLRIVRNTLQRATILKLNEEEMVKLESSSILADRQKSSWPESLIAAFHLDAVIVTLGAEGCLVVESSGRFASPGFHVKPKDTTGCGDAFTAAFLVSRLRGESMRTAVKKANALGAFVALRSGAVPEYSADDIERFIEKHGSTLPKPGNSDRDKRSRQAASDIKDRCHR